MTGSAPPAWRFRPAAVADFETLLALRIRALRPHLERVGRFHPDRARAYFRATFDPAHLRVIEAGAATAGCVALVPRQDHWELEHFYLDDGCRGNGLGSAVLRALLDEADAAGAEVRLGVLKESPAARLYRRHGFEWSHAEPYDDYFVRRPAAPGAPG